MENKRTQIRKLVNFVLDQFYISCNAGVVNAKDLEEFVVEGVMRRFGFTRDSALRFYRPCFWVLCSVDGRGMYKQQQIIVPNGKLKDYPNFLPLYLRKVRCSNGDFDKILIRYGETLLSRLEKAEYRGASVD